MPKKTFVAGEVLTAAEVNTYLMDQAVMSFAGTAARGSAIASPSEGMVSYLDDSNQLEVFDGSNWVGLAGASVGTATPASTAEGDFWLDTDPDGQVLKAYNSGWKNVGPVSHNAVINGDFGVWQRGTSFSNPADGYNADRWRNDFDTSPAPTTWSYSRQSFTPAEIEALGYGDAEYFARISVTTSNSTDWVRLEQRIEDCRTFSNQTVTLSFWAKAGASETIQPYLVQSFGSGGSSAVTTTLSTVSVTTSWVRYSVSVALPSVSGKTVGSGSSLNLLLDFNSPSDGSTLDFWGVQLEAGSVATPFRLAGGGSKAAELALCQRYYISLDERSTSSKSIGTGYYHSNTEVRSIIHLPVTMRTTPTLDATSGSGFYRMESVSGNDSLDSLTLDGTSTANTVVVTNSTDANGTGGYAGRLLAMSAGGDVALDAEL